MEGRPIWIKYEVDGIPVVLGRQQGLRVLHFKQILPAGVAAYGSHREYDILQFTTDPGGLRTVAVADVHLKNPNASKKEAKDEDEVVVEDDDD